MRKRIILLLGFLWLCSSLRAQHTVLPKNLNFLNKGVIYNSEWAVEPRINTNGFSLGLLFGTIKKYNVTHFRKIELGYRKHAREHRRSGRQNAVGVPSGSYAYGKVNYLFPIRASIGTKRYFSEKAKRRGIAVGLSYEAGPTLGIMKPYLLRIVRLDASGENQIITEERYTEDNAADFLDDTKILGKAGLFKGFDGFTIKPGISAKIGPHFAWGAYDESVVAIEVGIMLDIYFSKIELVATDDNQPYYLGFYLSAQFGRRK